MDLDSYFICATPRTGSTLLCALLASAGVAGRPESYFRWQDELQRAKQWGVADPSGAFDYADFIRHALAAGKTENGIFAARLMWGTLDELVDKLRPLFCDSTDLELLHRAFGRTRFVYVRRDNELAQAVSWSRALQTGVWAEVTDSPAQPPNAPPPKFDRAQIEELLAVVNEHNSAWREWFAESGVQPYEVRYEDLDRDPVATTRGVLAYLDVQLPQGRAIAARHRRQADEVNHQWIEQYPADP
jgi:LPS sulfotransferase NodH